MRIIWEVSFESSCIRLYVAVTSLRGSLKVRSKFYRAFHWSSALVNYPYIILYWVIFSENFISTTFSRSHEFSQGKFALLGYIASCLLSLPQVDVKFTGTTTRHRSSHYTESILLYSSLPWFLSFLRSDLWGQIFVDMLVVYFLSSVPAVVMVPVPVGMQRNFLLDVNFTSVQCWWWLLKILLYFHFVQPIVYDR